MSVLAPKRPPVAAGAGVLLLLAAVIGLAIIAGVVTSTAGDCGEQSVGSVSDKVAPAKFVPIYGAAAARYKLGPRGPAILASIHSGETGFGRLNKVTSSAGAQGHMQFMPGTWRIYGVDANGNGTRSQYEAEDAIHAAAKYLRASGAPKDWRRAVFAYNHADWYVREVLERADRMQRAGTASPARDDPAADADAPAPIGAGAEPGGADCAAGGPVDIAGSPADVINRVVVPLARKHRMQTGNSVAAVRAANGRHGPTVSGGRSDHQGPPSVAWAADMSNGTSPTPQMDALARDISRAFDIPWKGSGAVSATHKGYRVQIIYRSSVGGNHFNHVHFGVRKG